MHENQPTDDGVSGDLPTRPAPSLRTRFFRLTFINILANITVPLVGLVDAAMLGQLPQIGFWPAWRWAECCSITFTGRWDSCGWVRRGPWPRPSRPRRF